VGGDIGALEESRAGLETLDGAQYPEHRHVPHVGLRPSKERFLVWGVRFAGLRLTVYRGWGCGVWGLGFGVWGLGFGVRGVEGGG